MRILEVVGVRVDAPSGAPVLLLKDQASSRYLPIWIGAVEASAIANGLEGVIPPRPLTHDLLAQVVRVSHPDAVSIEITSVRDGIYHAEMRLGEHTVIDARPSDVVALAIRLGVEVTCPDELLVEAGVELSGPPEDEVEAFREFLDNVNADDFESDNP